MIFAGIYFEKKGNSFGDDFHYVLSVDPKSNENINYKSNLKIMASNEKI